MGGMWEEKDRRFTLDDIWTMDMVKLKEWKPLLESTETGLRWEGSDDEWEDEEDDENADVGRRLLVAMLMTS